MPDYKGKKVLIMGYGLNLHGSGTQAAKYLAEKGAILTITDLRDAKVLEKTMHVLKDYPVKWVLGEHHLDDFSQADFVVKNPGVHKNSPYLQLARKIESDISLFLKEKQPFIIAISGSKGKSTTSSLIFHILQQCGKKSFLAGNITVSPLFYLDKIHNEDTLVLELSSWQAGDLIGKKLLCPKISLMTNLLPDHQNYYKNNMHDYADDKSGIFLDQSIDSWTIFNLDNEWTPYFTQKSCAQKAYFSLNPIPKEFETGAYFENDNIVIREKGMSTSFSINNSHILKENILAAILTLRLYGLEISEIQQGIASFKGLKHRLEWIGEYHDISYYNDTTATMPLASIQSIKHLALLGKPIHVLFGGADKNLDFNPIKSIIPHVSTWHIFEGTAYEKINAVLLSHTARKVYGPFSCMADILVSAQSHAKPGDIVILSPGAASFGLFINEFDRGEQFENLIKNHCITHP
ncbi:MAG: UDP-N-acetylmuramoyl-L-alanine--D-glutamate ligase [Spirochaetia bacterium]